MHYLAWKICVLESFLTNRKWIFTIINLRVIFTYFTKIKYRKFCFKILDFFRYFAITLHIRPIFLESTANAMVFFKPTSDTHTFFLQKHLCHNRNEHRSIPLCNYDLLNLCRVKKISTFLLVVKIIRSIALHVVLQNFRIKIHSFPHYIHIVEVYIKYLGIEFEALEGNDSKIKVRVLFSWEW